jgi:hypothetical protein
MRAIPEKNCGDESEGPSRKATQEGSQITLVTNQTLNQGVWLPGRSRVRCPVNNSAEKTKTQK